LCLAAEAAGLIGTGFLRPAEADRGVSDRCRRGRGEPPSDIPGRSGLTFHRSGNGAGGPCPGSRRGSDPPKRTPTSPRWFRTREVRDDAAEAASSVPSRAPEFLAPFRGPRFQVPGSGALRGSGRLRGLAPLTSPLRRPTVSSGVSPVSPMGLFPLRGPLSSAAVPQVSGAEASGSRRSPVLPKQVGLPGKAPRIGRPVRGASVRSPQRVARGVRSIPSWVARDAPTRDCSSVWFRRAAPEVCPGARVASRSSASPPSVAGRCSVGAVSPASMVFLRQRPQMPASGI